MGFQRKLKRAITQNLQFPLNLNLWSLLGEPPIAVSFTGGLGAQVISTAIYELLKSIGLPVWANFSYFKRPHRINNGNSSGEISYFPWQLNELGIFQDSFSALPPKSIPWFSIDDGPVKLGLFLEAVNNPTIRLKLSSANNPDLTKRYLPSELSEKRYGCVHIRRGDYISVASHIVSDAQLADASGLWASDVDLIVALSDSPISPEAKRLYQECTRKPCLFADDVSAISSFVIMQNAQYLICSNSQFSLAAGMSAGLPMLIPSQWYSYPDEKRFSHSQAGQLAEMEDILVRASSFMLVKSPTLEQKILSITNRSSFFRFI